MNKFSKLLLVVSMSYTLTACGSNQPSGNDNAATEEQAAETEEKSHEVDKIDIETEDGILTFTGVTGVPDYFYNVVAQGDYEMTKLINFNFTNKQSKPSGPSDFKITVYQNGHEIDGPSSWGSSTPEMENMYNTALKDGTMPVAVVVIIEDKSPLTIMVEPYSDEDAYQMMEVELPQ